MQRKWIKVFGVTGLCFLIFGTVTLALFVNVQLPTLLVAATISQLVLGAAGVGLYLFFSFGDALKGVKQNQERLLGLLGVALFFLIVVGVNIVAQTQFEHLEFDSTSNRIFSLNDQSLQVLENLNADVEVLNFVQIPDARKAIERVMDRYLKASDKIRFQSLDPDKHPERKLELGGNDNQVVFVNTETQKVEYVDFRFFSEQEVTNALRRVASDREDKIYFLEGPDFDLRNEIGMGQARLFLEREGFKIETLKLATERKVPEDASLVVVWQIRASTTPQIIEALSEYLKNGGKVILAQSPQINPQTRTIEFGSWNRFLAAFNTAFEEKLTMSTSPSGREGLKLFAETLAQATGTSQLAQQFSQNQDFALLYATQSLRRLKEEEPQGLSRDVFLKSFGDVVQVKSLEGVELTQALPRSRFQVENDKAIGVILTQQHGEAPDSPTSQLIVLGNAFFALNAYFNQGIHKDLFLNLFHYILETDSPLVIREKTWPRSTLNLTKENKLAVIFASIFIIPELIIIFGMVFWVLRRSRA